MPVLLIPALNEDCVVLIISFLDKASLLNVAHTSRAGKATALPTLFHTVTLHTDYPAKIVQFCHSVLRNRLAHCIRHLDILSGPYTVVGSALRNAILCLVDVIALTDSLASLRIYPSAHILFQKAPELLDSLHDHPPSHTLELISITYSDWLARRPSAGLHNLSLQLICNKNNPLDLCTITTGSAASLNSMHLVMAHVMVPVILTEVCMPCPKLRMLSIAGAGFWYWYQTNTRQAPSSFHFTDLCKAFPNVQFIRCNKAVISLDARTLSGSATNEPQTLSELIGLQGDIESIALLGPLHKLRMVHITDYLINTLPSLTRLTTAFAGNSLCSLSLWVELQEPNWQDATRGLDAEQLFAEICRIAPRLRFLRLEMDIAIKPIGHRTHSSHLAVRQREAMAEISMVASSRLVGLDNLRCFCISFAPHIDKWAKELWEDFAALCIFDLPRVRFFVLDLIEDQICLERSEAATMHEDGVADIAEIDLDKEGVERLLERYQFEGSDWRLDGVADWLRSIQRPSR